MLIYLNGIFDISVIIVMCHVMMFGLHMHGCVYINICTYCTYSTGQNSTFWGGLFKETSTFDIARKHYAEQK